MDHSAIILDVKRRFYLAYFVVLYHIEYNLYSEYTSFFALRFLQGLGACSGIVLSRAIINDLMDKKTAGKLYLVIFPFVGTSPALAPLIGGLLLQVFNWQATFIFLSLFILSTILLCYFVLTETLPPQKRQSFTPVGVIKGSLGVLRNHQFIFYALIPCFAYATYFAYIVESPFFSHSFGFINLLYWV